MKRFDWSYIGFPAHIIAALFVPYNLVGKSFAAREWDTARFPAANGQWRAIEVVVVVPVIWAINSAALQPVFLNPVDEILLIGILTVVSNKRTQTIRCLFFYLTNVIKVKAFAFKKGEKKHIRDFKHLNWVNQWAENQIYPSFVT